MWEQFINAESSWLIGAGLAAIWLIYRVRRGVADAREQSVALRAVAQHNPKHADTRHEPTRENFGRDSLFAERELTKPYDVERDRIGAELHELAKELCARIDTKTVALQQLLIQTEQAIGRLNAALDQAAEVGLLADELPRMRADGGFAQREVDELRGEPIATLASVDTTAREERSSREKITGRIGLPPRLDEDPRFARIFALADGGLSASRIAAQTGMQIGEVELILSLRVVSSEGNEER